MANSTYVEQTIVNGSSGNILLYLTSATTKIKGFIGNGPAPATWEFYVSSGGDTVEKMICKYTTTSYNNVAYVLFPDIVVDTGKGIVAKVTNSSGIDGTFGCTLFYE